MGNNQPAGTRRGQRVRVGFGIDELKEMQKGHGDWPETIVKVISRVGSISRLCDNGDVVVDFPTAGEFIFNRAALETTQQPLTVPKMKQSIKSGDLVYILANENDVKRLQDSHGGWVDSMKTCLGKLAFVKKIFQSGDLRLRIGKTSWTFNRRATVEVNTEELMTWINEYQDSTEFSTGDIVQSLSNERQVKELQTGHGEWVDQMKDYLNLIGFVKIVFPNGDLKVRFAGACWRMNPRAVKKVAPCQANVTRAGGGELPGLLGLLQALAEVAGDLSIERADPELFEAVKNNNPAKVRERLQKGVNVDQKANGKHTAIQVASHLGHIGVMQVLIEFHADLDIQDSDGDYALHYAALKDQSEAVRVLLAAGANPNSRNKKGQTILHVSATRGSTRVAEAAIEKGANVNCQDNVGDCPIHDAIHAKQPSYVQLLINNGADLILRNSKGLNAFHLGVIRGEAGCVRCIMEHYKKRNQQFRVNEKKEDGFTALHLAALNNNMDCIRLLIEDGDAEKDALNNKHETPLYLASIKCHKDVVCYLVKAGCDPNIPDNDGDTPLHESLRRLSLSNVTGDFMVALLQAALETSGTKDAREVALCLAENGADPSITNNKGQSATDLCQDDDVKQKIIDAASTYATKNPRKSSFRQSNEDRTVALQELHKPKESEVNTESLNMSEDMDDKMVELKRLRAQVDRMKESKQCPICMETERSIIFSCGHGCCRECSSKITACPICRVDIVQRILTFN